MTAAAEWRDVRIARRTSKIPVLLAATLALLAGCGSPAEPVPPERPAETAGQSTAAPTMLTLPTIGLEAAETIPTGLEPSGELTVPPLDRPEEIVYANWTPDLAREMPTVLASHVNGRDADGDAIPGGFARLAEVETGDELALTRDDGTSARYRVETVETIDKDTFPTDRVYAPGPPGRVVLVTCGGVIDTEARSYQSNVIVSAVAIP